MRRWALATFVAVMAATAATSHAAPLGPLRIAAVRDGMGASGPGGLAIDATGRAWTVIRPNGEPVFAVSNGENVNGIQSAGADTRYAAVFQMPRGGILMVADDRGTIVGNGSQVPVSEPVLFQRWSTVGGPLGAWFWRYDDAGSGLALITPGGRVQYLPRTFSFQLNAYVVASDATGAWVSFRRADGAVELVRIDQAGSREVARFGVGSNLEGQTDPQGRLVILETGPGGSSLLRIEADGALRRLARLPRGLKSFDMGIDTHGTIWIADYLLPRIARVSPSGAVRFVEVGRSDDVGVRALAVAGDDVWFTTAHTLGRLVTKPGVCVVPDVRGLRVAAARRLMRRAGCTPTGTREGTLVVRQSRRPGRVMRTRAQVRLTSGPRRQLLTPAACRLARSTPVVARGRREFVTFMPDDNRHRRGAVWTACHAPSGRRTLLETAPYDPLAGTENLFDFSFAGTRVAYADLFGDRGGSNLWVRLMDMATGRRVLSAHVASSDGFGPTFPRLLRLITDGTRLLYLVRDPQYRPTPDGSIAPSYEQLVVVSAAGSRVIDEAPVGAIGDFGFSGASVTWTRDGQLRQAPAR